MIEIQEGWTVDETVSREEVKIALRRIAKYEKDLAAAQADLDFERNRCHHMHVSFQGQSMVCEVCGEELSE